MPSRNPGSELDNPWIIQRGGFGGHVAVNCDGVDGNLRYLNLATLDTPH